jgi:iron-sulfur cluster protein
MKNMKTRIKEKLNDKVLYENLKNFATGYKVSRENAYKELDFDALRKEMNMTKDFTLKEVEEMFEQFKSHVEASGSKVYRAVDAADANRYILDVCKKHNAEYVVKSKSMTSEETKLNDALEKGGIKPVETDLGEYILQVSDDHPSHMVMPAIHQTRGQVAEIFTKTFGRTIEDDIEGMVELIRQHLRQYYFKSEVGITGANVCIAETGTIGIVTNEGNARLSSTVPPVHVVLCGYEKLVRDFKDALKVIRMLPKSATGQMISTYVTWIKGQNPSYKNHSGYKETHYVFIDNGRLKYLEHPVLKEALKCIRCGSCANICPAYEMVGGHVFGHIYIGAIGLIYTALFHGEDKAKDILKLCTSCKACSFNCPSGIDLQHLIAELKLMNDSNLEGVKKLIYDRYLSNPDKFRSVIKMGKFFQKPLVDKTSHLKIKAPGEHGFRKLPGIADELFLDSFKKMEKKKGKNGKVFFYPGCAVEYFFPKMGTALVKLLQRAGIEVDVPKKSACCGLPAIFAGDRAVADKTIRESIKYMKNPDDYDAILVLCPSCGSALIENFGDFTKGTENEELAAKIADKTTSLAAYMESKGISFETPNNASVTYHTPCHAARGMEESAEPYLKALLGDKFKPMKDSAVCCGFAGSYSVDNPGISAGILGKKLENISQSGAEIVITDCPGCVLQIEGGVLKEEMPQKVMHLSQLLESLSIKATSPL